MILNLKHTEICSEIFQLISQSLEGPSWCEIKVNVQADDQQLETDTQLVGEDGKRHPIFIPTNVRIKLDFIREEMRGENGLSWNICNLNYDNSGKCNVEFDYETKPEFD